MTPKLPPDRQFGTVFATLFAVFAGVSYYRGGSAYIWLIGLGGLTGLVTLARPQWLRPLNAAWMKFAGLLHRVASPLVLAAIFFLVLTPLGILRRLSVQDPLRRKFDPGAHSYWIGRDPPGPPPESLRNQF